MRLLFKLLLLVLLVPIIYTGWNAADVWSTSRADQRPASDAIVVMGAAQYDGRPSPLFKARLDHARELFEAKVAPLIVVLGGKQEGDRFTEAEAGARYLEQELPADKVTGVKSGATTLDSLRRFTGLAEERRIEKIVIVSDPLHLARARAMAENFGFEAAVSPAKVNPGREEARSGLLRETAYLTFFRIFKRG